METSNPFNEFAQEYDQWYDRYHWVYQSELFAIERVLPKRANAVEIGVGSGRFAAPFGIGTGLDPSEKMLNFSRQRRIRVVQGIAEELPFIDGSFNLVLMVFTLCFLENVGKSLQEARRILKPGGELVIGIIDRLSELGIQYEKEKFTSKFFKNANFFTPEEITERLREKSFDDFFYVQTLFQSPDKVTQLEPVKNGYGKGSFVVVRGVKQ
jgi:ubiquinone/menaquinone biosynthesis C-methylase UbiE